VLAGEKTWEMRTQPTRIRELVGIIRTGSKALAGVCEIVGCHGPLDDATIYRTAHLHCCSPEDLVGSKGKRRYAFAWELAGARSFASPIPYQHIPGTQGWARIDAVAGEQVRLALNLRNA
jgi:hypothetical protein